MRSLLIGWEAILGFGLISFEYPRIASTIGSLNFITFAFAAAFSGWIGEPSCQCFGTVQTNPWLISVLDLVLALGLSRVAIQNHSSREGFKSYLIPRVVLALWACSFLALGIPSVLAANVRGDAFLTEGNALDFGDARPGEILSREIRVTNVTDTPHRLVGGSRDCSCRLTGLSTWIDPGQHAIIQIEIRVPASAVPGRYRRPVEVYTDVPEQPILRLTVKCRVR